MRPPMLAGPMLRARKKSSSLRSIAAGAGSPPRFSAPLSWACARAVTRRTKVSKDESNNRRGMVGHWFGNGLESCGHGIHQGQTADDDVSERHLKNAAITPENAMQET